jgi:hypothetical protein
VLFDRPSSISWHQGLTVTSEVTVDTLHEFIEVSLGTGEPSRMEVPPLSRTRRMDV